MVPAPADLEPSIRCLTSCILCDLLEEGVGSKNCGSPTSLHEATAPATHAPQELAARGCDLLHDPSQKATHRGDEPPANKDQKTSNNINYPSASGMHGCASAVMEHALRWRADHGHQHHRGPTDRGRQPNNTHWLITCTGRSLACEPCSSTCSACTGRSLPWHSPHSPPCCCWCRRQ